MHRGALYLTGIQVTFTLVVDQQAQRNNVLASVKQKIQFAVQIRATHNRSADCCTKTDDNDNAQSIN